MKWRQLLPPLIITVLPLTWAIHILKICLTVDGALAHLHPLIVDLPCHPNDAVDDTSPPTHNHNPTHARTTEIATTIAPSASNGKFQWRNISPLGGEQVVVEALTFNATRLLDTALQTAQNRQKAVIPTRTTTRERRS